MSMNPLPALGASLASPGTSRKSDKDSAVNPADFAAMLDKPDPAKEALNRSIAKNQEYSQMKKRINEVGFNNYVEEQREAKKLMEMLVRFYMQAKSTVKEELKEIVEHFFENPPRSIEEMYAYMSQRIEGMSKGRLKEKMELLFDFIQKLMVYPEAEREKMLQSGFMRELLTGNA